MHRVDTTGQVGEGEKGRGIGRRLEDKINKLPPTSHRRRLYEAVRSRSRSRSRSRGRNERDRALGAPHSYANHQESFYGDDDELRGNSPLSLRATSQPAFYPEGRAYVSPESPPMRPRSPESEHSVGSAASHSAHSSFRREVPHRQEQHFAASPPQSPNVWDPIGGGDMSPLSPTTTSPTFTAQQAHSPPPPPPPPPQSASRRSPLRVSEVFATERPARPPPQSVPLERDGRERLASTEVRRQPDPTFAPPDLQRQGTSATDASSVPRIKRNIFIKMRDRLGPHNADAPLRHPRQPGDVALSPTSPGGLIRIGDGAAWQQPRAATLKLDLLEGDGIPAKRPYARVAAECGAATTAVGAAKDPVWRQAFEVPVRDVTGDVVIVLLDDDHVLSTSVPPPVGRVVIPLSRLLSISGAVPPFTQWFDVYPAFRACEETDVQDSARASFRVVSRYHAGVPKVKGSGMRRGRKPLGRLLLRLEMNLEAPLHRAYLGFPKLLATEEDEQDALDEDGDPSPSKMVMKGNIARVKYLISGPPQVLRALCGFPQCILFPPVYFLVCARAEVWHLPMLAFVCVAGTGLASHYGLPDRYARIKIWEHDVPVIEESWMQKFKRYKGMYGHLQVLIGLVASGMERFVNLWNWSDPRITAVALGCLGVVCLALSLLLYLLPTRVVCYCLGLLLWAPLTVVVARRPKVASDEVRLTTITSPPPRKLRAALRRLGPVGNLLRRVPNDEDLVHRFIAMTQEASSSSLQAAVPSVGTGGTTAQRYLQGDVDEQ